jgi:hypothetical protein
MLENKSSIERARELTLLETDNARLRRLAASLARDIGDLQRAAQYNVSSCSAPIASDSSGSR